MKQLLSIDVKFKNLIFAIAQGVVALFMLIPGAVTFYRNYWTTSYSAISIIGRVPLAGFMSILVFVCLAAGVAYNLLVHFRKLKDFNLINLALSALEFLFFVFFMIFAASYTELRIFSYSLYKCDLSVVSYLLLLFIIACAAFAVFVFLQDKEKGIDSIAQLKTTKPIKNLIMFENNNTVVGQPVVGQPVAQPIPQPVAEPVAQPIPQPVAEPVEQPIPQPVAEPVVQPIPQPVAEPVAQPIPQPVENNETNQ